jgi:hypothetical protein
MTADPLLSLFPAPLLRLILCGDDVLPAAWGPLVDIYDELTWTWGPWQAVAYTDDDGFARTGDVLAAPEFWRLPLAHWSPRLAQVTARLLDLDDEPARIDMRGRDGGRVGLSLWGRLIATWEVADGRAIADDFDAPDLPALPRLLADHAPEVALLLAVWEATR